MIKKLIVFFFCAFSFVLQAQNTTTIPLDSRVKYGKLDNGLTYYVMHNTEPKERASLYFVQNVGAILEEDSQNGLAHFLEHMAFNGLEHYPGKSMLNYLEANGIAFGRDINAYTALDETVYNLSNIPTTKENLLDSALLVLHDWSGGLLLEGEEIESERGVIREEWRTRRNSRFRLNAQTRPLTYNYSKYAKRDVIGSLDVINNFEHQELKDYYGKWYRPELQAVVVVGDVDADKMVDKIKTLFSKIPVKTNVPERVYFPVEDSEELGYVVATDKEAQGVSLNWIFRHDTKTLRDESYVRNNLVQNIFNSMMNNRFGELTRKPDCVALGMWVGDFTMARTKDGAYISVSPKENKEKEAFALIMTEIERAQRHGFTASEFERAKTSLLRSYESYQDGYDKIDNETWAKQLGDHFLEASPFPSLNWELDFAQKTIPTITLEEVQSLFSQFSNINNSLFSITGPDKEGIQFPTKEALLSVLAKVKKAEIEAYEDDADESPLVEEELAVKNIVSEKPVEGTDAKLYTLENGARVVLLPTDYAKDEIIFSAYSLGGSSVLTQDQLESADLATTIASMSGAGKFSDVQLKKKLTGKRVSVRNTLGTNTEGFSGSASPKDFETMLQLLYLKFEHPRFEKEMFETVMASINNSLLYKDADNGNAFKDTISMVSANYHPRNLLFNQQFVNNIDFDKAVAVYKDRFQDASDFTFIFVGNLDMEKDLALIQKYIGSLSSQNREETWKDYGIKPANGHTKREIYRPMEVPKSTVYYTIYNDVNYSLKTRIYIRTIASLLDKRYLETIREEEGGSYGVGLRPSISKRNYEHATISMSFDCDPEKREKLTSILKAEIDKLVKEGVNADDLKEIQKNNIKSREEAEHENSFWLSVLYGSLINEEPIADTQSYNELINSMTPKSVQKFAKKWFKNYDSIEVVMSPVKEESK